MGIIRKLKALEYKFWAMVTVDILDTLKNPSADQKALAGTYAGSAAVLGSVVPALAYSGSGGNFFNSFRNMLNKLYGWLLMISSALAVCLIAFRILQYMAADDPQSAKMAKDNIKRIIIAWILINMLGALAVVIQELTKGGGWNGQQGDFGGGGGSMS